MNDAAKATETGAYPSFLSTEPKAGDEDKFWTTVGSTGTVDEADVGKVFLDGSVVQMGRVVVPEPAAKSPARKTAAGPQQTQSAVIRYNITAVDGLFEGLGSNQPRPAAVLTIRYLAQGSGARVVVKLIEVDLANGVEAARATFDSNNFPAADGYQTRILAAGVCDYRFDFRRKAYYVEATLTTSSIAVSAAGIQVIQVHFGFCLVG